jgi:hypothetical protein
VLHETHDASTQTNAMPSPAARLPAPAAVNRGETHSQLIDRASGKPVPKLVLHVSHGMTLMPTDTFVRKIATQK